MEAVRSHVPSSVIRQVPNGERRVALTPTTQLRGSKPPGNLDSVGKTREGEGKLPPQPSSAFSAQPFPPGLCEARKAGDSQRHHSSWPLLLVL